MSDSNNNLSLRPRARLLKTLGEELISNETVAVIELVKNSYDADASVVVIRLENSGPDNDGKIEVVDDGSGMSMEIIRNAWMEPATSTKKYAKFSKKLKRRVLGEKGIGRFASARLARQLELVTREEGSELESYVLFDWTQFDDDEKYLDEILFLTDSRTPNEIMPGRKIVISSDESIHLPAHGTLLRMTGLKKVWGDRDFQSLARGLARLVSPFSEQADFSVFLSSKNESGALTQIQPPELVNYPHYVISGEVNEDGGYKFQVKILESKEEVLVGRLVWVTRKNGSELLDLSEGDQTPDLFDDYRKLSCGPLKFEFRVWDRDDLGNVMQRLSGNSLGVGIRDIRRDLDSIAGINIYRDGFRVLPYGEPDTDFLRLDMRRVQKPTMRLSNNQIVGYVSISADANPDLRDRSNREGLDNNQAYEDLQSVLIGVLAKLEKLRYRARRQKPAGRNEKEGRRVFDTPDFQELKDQVSLNHPNDKELQDAIEQKALEVEQQISEIKEVVSKYHSLATLGGIIDKVLHECRQPLGKISAQADFGLIWLSSISSKLKELPIKSGEQLNADDGRKRFNIIKQQADLLNTSFKRIEPFGGRKKGRPKRFYLEPLISDVFALYERELSQLSVECDLPKSNTLVSVDPSEIQEVFINLLTNSLYWLERVSKDKRRISISMNKQDGGVLEILFSDSGPGVGAEHQDFIFDPYYSGKSDDGVGLGLSIVGEIIKDYYDGSLELVEPGVLGGATFRLILTKRVGG